MKDGDVGAGRAELRRSFASEAAAIPEVRRFALDAWRRLVPGSLDGPDGDVQLVVSELATNAVLHAGSEFGVSVTCDRDVVRISVDDRGTGRPAQVDPDGSSVGGRGLRIVESLSDAWGVDELVGGKSVWAEFRLD